MIIGDFEFADDLRLATRLSDGVTVNFTRNERVILETFLKNKGRVITRSALLDATNGIGSDSNDRNIDFKINRLRKKLGDSSTDPKFIATQYGEGYIWVGTPRAKLIDVSCRVLIGPIFGQSNNPLQAKTQKAVIDTLERAFNHDAIDTPPALVLENAPHTYPDDIAFARMAVSINFVAPRTGLREVVLIFRKLSNGAKLHTKRLSLDELSASTKLIENEIAQALAELEGALIHPDAPTIAGPNEEPLPLKLYNNGLLFQRSKAEWHAAEVAIRDAMSKRPNDPKLQVSLASILHGRMITGTARGFRDMQQIQTLRAEIEENAIASAPHLSGENDLSITAAKLLIFSDTRHRNLATDIAETAFAKSHDILTGCITMAQIRMWNGDPQSALELARFAMSNVEANTRMHAYGAFLLAQMHTCLGDHAAAAEELRPIIAWHPIRGAFVNLIYDPFSARAKISRKALLAILPIQDASALLRFAYVVSARMMTNENAMQQTMHWPTKFLVEKFGQEVIPPELRSKLEPITQPMERGDLSVQT